MVNESLEVFCNRDDIIESGDFFNLSIIKVKMGEENLVKIEKRKTYVRDFFRIISGNPRQFNYRDESANCAYLHS